MTLPIINWRYWTFTQPSIRGAFRGAGGAGVKLTSNAINSLHCYDTKVQVGGYIRSALVFQE